MTPEQVNDLTKLLTEFTSEIQTIHGNLNANAKQIADLQQAVTRIPPLRISIDGGWRVGLLGTGLTTGTNPNSGAMLDNAKIAVAGSPNTGTAPPLPGFQGSLDSTLRKDTGLSTRFGVYRTDIDIAGNVNNCIAGYADLRAITPVSSTVYGIPTDVQSTQIYSPLPVNTGIANYLDTLQLWEAYVTFSSPIFCHTVGFTAGRMTNKIGEGLLVDNEQQPLEGITLDTGVGPLTFGINGSFIDTNSDPQNFNPPVGTTTLVTNQPPAPADGYGYAYLGYGCNNWNIVGTYLLSGSDSERGYSFSGDARFCRIRVFAEYADLIKDPAGETPPAKHYAWVGGADLLNNWCGLTLTAKYGEVMPGYTITYCILNPYSSINAYDIDWVDRPLFLSESNSSQLGNVTQGWEIDLKYAFARVWLFSFRYYGGNDSAYYPTGNTVVTTDANNVWTPNSRPKCRTM